jgi:hypothetical protein
MYRFSLRDLLWLTLVLALAMLWLKEYDRVQEGELTRRAASLLSPMSGKKGMAINPPSSATKPYAQGGPPHDIQVLQSWSRHKDFEAVVEEWKVGLATIKKELTREEDKTDANGTRRVKHYTMTIHRPSGEVHTIHSSYSYSLDRLKEAPTGSHTSWGSSERATKQP